MAIVVVSCLLVGELLVRVIAADLPPRRGPEQEVVLKAEQLKAIGERGRRLDVVFVGSSTADAGVDPTLFDKRSRFFSTSYNAALKGLPMKLVRRWLEGTVIPRAHPRLAVVDVQPTQVLVPRGAGASEYLRSIVAYRSWLQRVRDTPLSKVDRSLSHVSELMRYRSDLQKPVNMGHAARDTFLRRSPQEQLAADSIDFARAKTTRAGRNLEYREAPRSIISDPGEAKLLNSILDYGYDLSDTRALLSWLKGRLSVVLTVMPIDVPTLVDLGLSKARYDSAVDKIKAMAADLDLPLLVFDGATYPRLDFHDKVHLADPGAARYTAELARRIDELCQAGEVDC